MKKILLIEDNATARMHIAATLEAEFPGFSVVTPESWAEAEAKIAKLSPNDVVVTDGNLWAPYTASDVFAALAQRGMARCVVLYSSDPEHFPEFHAFASKPQLGELVEFVRSIVR